MNASLAVSSWMGRGEPGHEIEGRGELCRRKAEGKIKEAGAHRRLASPKGLSAHGFWAPPPAPADDGLGVRDASFLCDFNALSGAHRTIGGI